MVQADYRQLNGIALAYLGDAAYEVYIRQHLLTKGISKPTKLQHIATHYVSAKAQAALIDLMKEDELLSDEEWSYFKRGRNANSHTHAKNTSVMTYRISTGFEAVMGYLKLAGKEERLAELAQWCIKQVEAGRTAHEK
ncbi:Mini-ribonuclease 3 [Limosilactobacillus reuteri]|jgi:ribonuclease-3 family protein|uniref:Mini-ribonuclease 3 n=2 Tax=Limosilactobacillus reuteri TaxID=1598 RepID=A0A0U5JRG4_LIMRT|nr:Mini-ribonuclease 3 [Limosilactobacillus reuteri]CUR39702.1 COG1939: Ribonuclease III family protein [Limosilactobacillus reuteri subsp. porcinus]AGR63758.1 Mini-ribonuclease 3 [Limosilactobacillus reuteri TD1]ANU52497.1 Mini-ribonuclease 3 [Limosilactobacillus reuteri]MBU5283708.1 Mini-ribonuclease 3 [Limosilactobacillus reuteri]MCC4341223.1 Mini-ribonuclease 3 [Limosilactobacillus reuteri]